MEFFFFSDTQSSEDNRTCSYRRLKQNQKSKLQLLVLVGLWATFFPTEPKCIHNWPTLHWRQVLSYVQSRELVSSAFVLRSSVRSGIMQKARSPALRDLSSFYFRQQLAV